MVKKKESAKPVSLGISQNKIIKKINMNSWAIVSIILAIVLIVSLFTGGFSSSDKISSQEAGQKIVEFAEKQGATAQVVSVEDQGSLYLVTVNIQGQEVPVYVTSDGKSLVPSIVPLTATSNTNSNTQDTPTPTNIPKSDKPTVEVFVMSHCPYGTQIEKGILPVASLLKDKIDFEIKFVYYAMHGEVEVYEQLNQYCIQEEQNDKFLNYLTCFLEDGDSARCLAATNIDTAKLKTCTTAADTKFDITKNFKDTASYLSGKFPLFNTHKEDNTKYDVGGSPTLIINGVNAQVNRDSASLLQAVCNAFNTAPTECETVFDSEAPSPGFGVGTAQASNNAIAGCEY
jgi:hypothetical protein